MPVSPTVSPQPAMTVIVPPPGRCDPPVPVMEPTDSTVPPRLAVCEPVVVIAIAPPEQEFERMIEPVFKSTFPLATVTVILPPVLQPATLPSMSAPLSITKSPLAMLSVMPSGAPSVPVTSFALVSRWSVSSRLIGPCTTCVGLAGTWHSLWGTGRRTPTTVPPSNPQSSAIALVAPNSMKHEMIAAKKEVMRFMIEPPKIFMTSL